MKWKIKNEPKSESPPIMECALIEAADVDKKEPEEKEGIEKEYAPFVKDGDNKWVLAQPGDGQYNLPLPTLTQLYPYQRRGVAWLWRLYHARQGGILGDDMGLGKTCQVLCFLRGLFASNLGSRVLLVLSVSLLKHWEEQLVRWYI